MNAPSPENALDHVVVVMFENRSFDNLLGRLYHPGEVPSFDGVLGKDLSNPIPDWAEDGAHKGTVGYGVAANMDTPIPIPARSSSTSTPSCSGASTRRATAACRPSR
jgi:phospholipase C